MCAHSLRIFKFIAEGLEQGEGKGGKLRSARVRYQFRVHMATKLIHMYSAVTATRLYSPPLLPCAPCLQGAKVALQEEIEELERREGVLLGALSDESWAEVCLMGYGTQCESNTHPAGKEESIVAAETKPEKMRPSL